MSICLLFMLPKKIEVKRIQVSEVTGFLLFEMVYHTEPQKFQICITKMIQSA